MDEIIASIAWECGDKDCPIQWHRSNYWIGDGGYTVDRYSDGDHEDVEEADLPSIGDVMRSWSAYARFVRETGTDPLGEYNVKRSVRRSERWRILFSRSISGVRVRAKRRGQRWVGGVELPEHVREYACADSRGVCEFPFEVVCGLQDIRKLTPMTAGGSFLIEHESPRSQSAIARELRRLAGRRI